MRKESEPKYSRRGNLPKESEARMHIGRVKSFLGSPQKSSFIVRDGSPPKSEDHVRGLAAALSRALRRCVVADAVESHHLTIPRARCGIGIYELGDRGRWVRRKTEGIRPQV